MYLEQGTQDMHTEFWCRNLLEGTTSRTNEMGVWVL